jgi:hypothetical protein
MFKKSSMTMYVVELTNNKEHSFIDTLKLRDDVLIGVAIERHTSAALRYSWSDFIAVCLDR